MTGCLRRACGVLLLATSASWAAPSPVLQATTSEPRSFGYQVGDVLERQVHVHVPAGLQLDETSLPRSGARGLALELRSVLRKRAGPGDSWSDTLTLRYQVFIAPAAVRTLELPAFTLRYLGTRRDEDLRVQAWPVTVAPLVPVDVSPRVGLGELQADQPPPLIATGAARWRLGALLALLMMLGSYLAVVYVGLPGWQARRRPFGLAWQSLRHLPAQPTPEAWRAACLQLHQALNHSAGHVVFEARLDDFVRRQTAFAGQHEALRKFLQQSNATFFATATAGAVPPDGHALRELCRRCRDAERGS
jgi:mxaA protein